MNNIEERNQIAFQGQGPPNPNPADLRVKNWNDLSRKNFAINQDNSMTMSEDNFPNEGFDEDLIRGLNGFPDQIAFAL